MSPSPRALLYIEDNPANVRLLEFVVAREDHLQLTSAVSAEEGIEMARRDQPDLILMDISLPGMDGYEALKHLKNDSRTSHIPVMAVSATVLHQDVERGQAAGFVEYLTKPIIIDDFLAAVERVLDAD